MELPTSFVHRTYESAGAHLHYLHWANPGKPVLVGLPGFQETARSFFFLEPYLRANFELYFLDWRGHGESPPLSEGTYNTSTLLYDLAMFDISVLPDSYFLIGHCLGADMAALWAALRPDRVRAAVLIEGLLTPHDLDRTSEERRQIEELQTWLKRLQFSMKTGADARRPGMKDEAEVERALAWMHPGLATDQYSTLAQILTKRRDDHALDWHYAPHFPTRWLPLPAPATLLRQLWRKVECPVLWLTNTLSSDGSAPASPQNGERDRRMTACEEIASHFRMLDHQSVDAPASGIHNARSDQVEERMKAFFGRLAVDSRAHGELEANRSHMAPIAGQFGQWMPRPGAAAALDRAADPAGHSHLSQSERATAWCASADEGGDAADELAALAASDRLHFLRPGLAKPAAVDRRYTDLAHRIRAAVAHHLQVPEASVDLETPFASLGVDSLGWVTLMTTVQAVTSHPLSLSHLNMFPTIAALARFLSRDHDAAAPAGNAGRAAPLAPVLIPFQAMHVRRPLFFAGGVTGAVSPLMPLAQSMSSDQPFYAFQPPGLDGLEDPLTRIEDLAVRFIDGIREVQQQGPFILGGHSFGGLVAYEAAVQLQRQGAQVAHVFILDTWLDRRFSNEVDGVQARWELFLLTTAHSGAGTWMSLEAFCRLSTDEQNQRLRHAMNLLDASSSAVERIVKLYIANRKALARYRPARSNLPVTVFVATEDIPHPFREIMPPAMGTDASLGWQQVCADALHVVPVPGNHLSMLVSPNVDEVALHCRERLGAEYVDVRYMPRAVA